jgi:hypothetical protein
VGRAERHPSVRHPSHSLPGHSSESTSVAYDVLFIGAGTASAQVRVPDSDLLRLQNYFQATTSGQAALSVLASITERADEVRGLWQTWDQRSCTKRWTPWNAAKGSRPLSARCAACSPQKPSRQSKDACREA